ARGFAVEAVRFIALRRDREIVGLQMAVYREGRPRGAVVEERIARGIAYLASLAIEHARLIDELHRAVRLRSEFLAPMSQELRAPLNVLLSSLGRLLAADFRAIAAEQEEALRRVAASAEALLDLVENTLDLGRFEKDAWKVDVGEVRVEDLIHELEVE